MLQQSFQRYHSFVKMLAALAYIGKQAAKNEIRHMNQCIRVATVLGGGV
jgi:hypothetical protein